MVRVSASHAPVGAVLAIFLLPGLAMAGTEAAPDDMPPTPPGMGPGMGMPPMMGPGGRAMPEAGPHEPGPLDKLADQRWRPVWAPLPMFRGELGMVPLLHELLADASAEVRARSALILGQIACPSSTELLAAGLKDPERSVRVQCGLALAQMGDARGIDTCSAVLVADPAWVRLYAVFGLWRTNSESGKAALRRRSAKQDTFISGVIKSALETPYVAPPPVPALAAGAKTDPRPELAQVWEQAADVFTSESDWWFHAGDYDQAIRASEASILLDPEYVETYSVVAWLQWSMGDDATAIQTLRRGIQAAPEDPNGYFNLGYHYFNTKRYDEAEPLLKKAVDLGGDQIARRMYAHCLEKLGRPEDALTFWEAILKDNPTDGVAIMHRDRLKAKLEGGG